MDNTNINISGMSLVLIM